MSPRLVDEAGYSPGKILVQPAVDRIGISAPVQPEEGHMEGSLALGDLEQGRGTLPQIGPMVPIPGALELGSLLRSQRQRTLVRDDAPPYATAKPTTTGLSC